jgi:hypothetical protein
MASVVEQVGFGSHFDKVSAAAKTFDEEAAK